MEFHLSQGWRRFLLFLSLAGLSAAMQGCMLATQQDLVRLDDSLVRMRKNQADLVTKMSELSGNLESLNSQLESSQQQMGSLSNKLDDLQSDLARRMSVLSGHVTGASEPVSTNPNDLFRLAYNDYQAGKFDLAIVGFRNILSQFGQSSVAPKAQLYIGECEYGRKNYSEAMRAYDAVVSNYPKDDHAPQALFKKATAYEELGKDDKARAAYKDLLKDYPSHKLAKTAKDALAGLGR